MRESTIRARSHYLRGVFLSARESIVTWKSRRMHRQRDSDCQSGIAVSAWDCAVSAGVHCQCESALCEMIVCVVTAGWHGSVVTPAMFMEPSPLLTMHEHRTIGQ